MVMMTFMIYHVNKALKDQLKLPCGQ